MSCCCKGGRVRQIFAGVTGGICLLIVGSWTGWISPFLHKMESGEEVQFDLTISEKSWVVSIPDLMHLIVSIPGGYVLERLGRKPVFLITALFYQISGILAVFGTSVNYLYLSRMACGIASALTYMVVPMYLAEIAETEIRGATSALFTVLLWGGTLLSNTLALFFTIKTLEIILSIMPLIFTFLVICFLPESPYYHLTKDNNKKAHKSLARLRDEKDEKGSSNVSEIQRELDEMYAQVRKEMEYRSRWMDLISTKGTRRATLVVMTISVMQRFTGINVMLSYMAIELPSGGGGLSADECVIMFGLLLMVTSLGSMIIIDRLGRKPALYASGIVCSILQGVIAYYYYSKKLPDHDISHIKWIPYVCMLLFAVFYQAGIGIISHTLLGEMFPANVKNKAAAATNIVFSISSFIILKTFPIISKTYGADTMFIIFAISNALSAVFTFFFVVETKGKTLGEIQEILNR